MKNRILFKILSIFGFIAVIVEIFMRVVIHSTICRSEGCVLVSQYVRFGEVSMLILGAVLFFVLAFLSFLEKKNETIGLIIDSISIIAVSVEGFLVGYQIFRLNKYAISFLLFLQ